MMMVTSKFRCRSIQCAETKYTSAPKPPPQIAAKGAAKKSGMSQISAHSSAK